MEIQPLRFNIMSGNWQHCGCHPLQIQVIETKSIHLNFDYPLPPKCHINIFLAKYLTLPEA